MSEVTYRILDGFPDFRVGDDGSIWSCCRSPSGQWRRLSGTKNKRGYLETWVANGGGRRLVHHLVLEAFVGPKPDGAECRHLDGDPLNNALTNLAWGTPQENAEDRVRHGTTNRGQRMWAAKLTDDAVRDIRACCKLPPPGRKRVRDGMKTKMAAKYGVSRAVIGEVVSGKLWAHVV